MFTTTICPKCGPYEFYMNRKIVEPCPHCGFGKFGGKPLTSEEFYNALGINTQKQVKK